MRFTVPFLTAALLPSAFAHDCPQRQAYVKGVGCLPKLYRDGKTMVYMHQKLTQNLKNNRISAKMCGGHLASILSQKELWQIRELNIRYAAILIGYTQPADCNDKPKGCWTWDDGSEVGFTNWASGKPDDLRGQQNCAKITTYNYLTQWIDYRCSYKLWEAVYILPVDFTKYERCQWYVEPEPSSSSNSPSFSSKAPSFSSKSPSFSSKSPSFSSKAPSFSSKSPSFSSKSPTTEQPTGGPTLPSTEEPTEAPTNEPTNSPTPSPTEEPTGVPTEEPSNPPTPFPTEEPTAEPTEEPTAEPTEEPTAEPTEVPTAEPTQVPTVTPTDAPTVTPTETPVCKFGKLKLCLKGGCIWTPEKGNKPAKCAPCSDEKKSKSCVKNGCVWRDAKGKKAAECSACADQKTNQCSKKGCVTTKAKGKTTCTSCVSLSTSKTKCFQGKCAYDIKKKTCVTCVSVTKEKSCDQQKGCAWKPGKRGKKGTCDRKKGKIELDCCDWGSEPCDLDCNARQETLNE